MRRRAPRAQEEQHWQEQTIKAAEARPWRPSWERSTESSSRNGEAWRRARRPENAWQPHAVASLRRRIWASKKAKDTAKEVQRIVQEVPSDLPIKDEDTQTSATVSEVACNESALSHDADLHSEPSSETPDTAEESLRDILAKLQAESAKLSSIRDTLFNAVRRAAEEALEENFDRMTLVGSVALHIDIPASDVDAVVFTKRGVESIQALRATATALRAKEPELCVQVIATARIPILLVSTADHRACMDMSVNQPLPDLHASWMSGLSIFQQEHARDFLRCIKYWHSQRQIPGSKEGGYPALAWLFLALQVLTVNNCEEGSHCTREQRVLSLLRRFFELFDANLSADFWPFPRLEDPVDGRSLVQEIPLATELFYAAECLRARRALATELPQLFEARQSAALPAAVTPRLLAVLKAKKLWLVKVLAVSPRAGWTAPFLHRCDGNSAVRGSLLGIGPNGVLTQFPAMRGIVDFAPCDFVASFSEHALLPSDLQSWQDMRQLLEHAKLQVKEEKAPGRPTKPRQK